MEKLTKLNLIIVALGLVVTWSHWSRDFNEEKQNLTKLINNGVQTACVINDEYSYKVKKRDTTYTFTYTFSVEDKKYEVEKRRKEMPDSYFISITYLPEDPTINSEDPKKELERTKTTEASTLNMVGGPALLLVGLSMFAYRRKQKNKNKQEA